MASLSPGIGSLAQGYGLSGAGRYSARLDAFTKNAKDIEAYDFGTAVESEEAKKQKDAATFIEVASGFKTVPNTSNMYNKHHALLSKKYEVLFSDENMTAMAATPEGRAKFSQAVEQLNQEAKAYENIYDATFGDPNKADGKGFTYSDYQRRKSSGGNKQFFQSQGFEINKTDQEYEQQLISLDNSSDIGNITFDPATGTWGGYDPNDPLLSMDMNTVSQYFSYDLRQIAFNSPSTYAQEKPLYDLYQNQDSAAVTENLQARRPMMELEAVAYYQSTLEDDNKDKDLTPQQYRDKLASNNTLYVAHEAFESRIIEGLEARKKREEEEKKGKKQQGNRDDGGSGFKQIPNTIANGVLQLSGLSGITLTDGQRLAPRGIKLLGNDLVLIYGMPDGKQGELVIGNEWEKDWLEATFGRGAADKIKQKLGATTTTTPAKQGDKAQAGGDSRLPQNQ